MTKLKEILASIDGAFTDGSNDIRKRLMNLPDNINYEKEHNTTLDKEINPKIEIGFLQRLETVKRLEERVPQTISHSMYIDREPISDIIHSGLKGVLEHGSRSDTMVLVNNPMTKKFLFDISEKVSNRIVRNINLYREMLNLNAMTKSILYENEYSSGATELFNNEQWQALAVLGSNLRLDALADYIFNTEVMKDFEFLEHGESFSIYLVLKKYRRTRSQGNGFDGVVSYYYEFAYQMIRKGVKNNE